MELEALIVHTTSSMMLCEGRFENSLTKRVGPVAVRLPRPLARNMHTSMQTTTEQAIHARINVGRFVKRLENLVSDEDWSQDIQTNTWIKTQRTLQVSKLLCRKY